MEIEKKLKKDPWTRRVSPDSTNPRFNVGFVAGKAIAGAYNYISLTQQDFLNELSPAAHPVNSAFYSKRPIYGPTGNTDKNGKTEWKIVGYDDVETVSLGWQEFICNNKVAHMSGNGFDLANETENEDAFNKLVSWFDYIGLKDAYKEAVFYAERSGDSGIFIRQTGPKTIEYDVYSIEKGYIIYPQLDEEGNPEYYVEYKINGRKAVDIYSSKGVETWIQYDSESEGLFGKLKFMFDNSDKKKSSDGYVRIKKVDNQLGGEVQFVYFRVPDVSWGPAQLSIEDLEHASSYVAEEVKSSAFPILFVKSEKITSLPPSRVSGKTIGLKGSSDQIQHADAKFLAPPDASNIATIHIKNLRENIIHSTMSAIIEPEIMKAGADSSTSIKILFRPEIEWAMLRWIYYVKPVKRLVNIAKGLVEKVEGVAGNNYSDVRMSVWQNIWIPENEAEQVKIQLDQYYAGVKSAKAVMTDIGNTHLGDWEQILKEKREMNMIDAETGVETVTVNPTAPGITNQAMNQPKGK